MERRTREELLRLIPEQDSLSFARHPCVVASDKLARVGVGSDPDAKDEPVIVFEEQLRDSQGNLVFSKTGTPVLKRWRISAQEGRYIYYEGRPKRKVTRTEKMLPFGDDQKTLVLSGYLVLKKGDLDRGSFEFSSYEFLKLMGKAPNAGSNHIWLHNSFIRLRRALLQSRYVFVDPVTGAYIPKVRDTNLITDLDIIDIGDGKLYREHQLQVPCNSATVCEFLLADFKNGLSVTFDLEFFRALIPLADSIYRCINSALGEDGCTYREDVFIWAKRLGLGRVRYPSDLMHSLKRAHVDLRQWKWLRCDPEIIKGRDGSYEIVYKLNTRHQHRAPMDPLVYDPLFRELLKRGINMTTAARLLNERPKPYIEEKIVYFDFEKGHKGEHKIKSGWLVRAIEEDYTAPEGFVPKAEREKQARQAEEKKQEREVREKEAFEQERRRYAQRRAKSPWNDLWEQMANDLRGMLSPETFSCWIEPTMIADVKDDVVVLSVPNAFFARWIQEHYTDSIQGVLSTIRGQPAKLQFVCDDVRGREVQMGRPKADE